MKVKVMGDNHGYSRSKNLKVAINRRNSGDGDDEGALAGVGITFLL